MKNKNALYLTQASLIATIYVLFTLLANSLGLANQAVQVRFSEALTILPLFTPAAIPGLFIGCLVGNVLTGAHILDIIFGSLATLLGAFGTYFLRKRWFLAPIPPIVANTLIIPLILSFVYQFEGSIPFFMVTVGVGEIISCGILGYLLYFSLKKYQKYLFQ